MVDEKNPILDEGGDDAAWALEVTQMKLLISLKKQETESKKQSKLIESIEKTLSEAAPDAVEFYKEFEKFAKQFEKSSAISEKFYTTDFIRTSKQSADIIKKTLSDVAGTDGDDISKSEAIQNLTGDFGHLKSNVNSVTKMFGSLQIPNIADNVDDIGDGISMFGARLAVVNPVLGAAVIVFGSFIGAAAGLIQTQFKVWTELAQVGRTFSGSMFEMSATIYGAGLTLDEGAALLKKFSHVAANIGDKELLSLQKQVRGLSSQLGNYGLSVQQIAELTASYVETQTALGIFGELTEKQQAAAINKYVGQLSTLSKLTGKNIQDIENERKALVETGDMVGSMAMASQRLGQEAGKNFAKTMAETSAVLAAMPGTTGKMMNEQLMNMASFGNKAMGEFGQLTSILGGDFSNIMDRMFKASTAGDFEGTRLAAMDYTQSLVDMSNQQKSTLQIQSRGSGPLASAAREMLDNQQKLSSRFSELKDKGLSVAAAFGKMQKETESQEAGTKAMAAIGDKWREIMGSLAVMMQGPLESMFDMFVSGFNSINNSGIFQLLVDNIGVIVDIVGSVLGPIFWALGRMFDALMVILGPIIETFRVVLNVIDFFISGIKNIMTTIFNWMKGLPIIGDLIDFGEFVGEKVKENVSALTAGLGGLADGIGDAADALDKDTDSITDNTEVKKKEKELQSERAKLAIAGIRESVRAIAREKIVRSIGVSNETTAKATATAVKNNVERQVRIREIDTELPAAQRASEEAKRTTTTIGISAAETNVVATAPTADTLERLIRSTEKQNELLEGISATNKQAATSAKKSEPKAFEGVRNSI